MCINRRAAETVYKSQNNSFSSVFLISFTLLAEAYLLVSMAEARDVEETTDNNGERTRIITMPTTRPMQPRTETSDFSSLPPRRP